MDAEAYVTLFIRPFTPIYKRAVLRSSIKPLGDIRLCEEPGCIFINNHYEFNDDYFDKVRDSKTEQESILKVAKHLKVYKSKRGGWGVLPVASLISDNTENRQKELCLADAFLTILREAELGDADLREFVNGLDFFRLFEPIPGNRLLERPADLNQFIIMPERHMELLEEYKKKERAAEQGDSNEYWELYRFYDCYLGNPEKANYWLHKYELRQTRK